MNIVKRLWFWLFPTTDSRVRFRRTYLPGVGDYDPIPWGWVCELIDHPGIVVASGRTKKEARQLALATLKNLEAGCDVRWHGDRGYPMSNSYVEE